MLTATLPAWLQQVTSYPHSKARDDGDSNAVATAQDTAGDIASAIASFANQLYQYLHEVRCMLLGCTAKLLCQHLHTVGHSRQLLCQSKISRGWRQCQQSEPGA